MQIAPRTTGSFLNEDQRWLGNGGEPIGKPRSIVLDKSAFDLVTAFPNGFIPSGVALAKVDATGLYVPYGASPSEVQTLTFDATGGTYTLVFDGETTPSLTYANTTGDTATIQAALDALSNINPGDVTVTRGTPAGAVTIFTLTFGGRYVGLNVPQLTNTESLTGGNGTLANATTTAGGGSASGGQETGRGLLFASVPYDRASAAGDDIGAALFWSGEVVQTYLPAGHGVDAAFRADTPQIAYL